MGMSQFESRRERGKAALAWRYTLTKQDVKIIELWCTGASDEQIKFDLCLSDYALENRKRHIFQSMNSVNVKKVCAVAGGYGLGPEDHAWIDHMSS